VGRHRARGFIRHPQGLNYSFTLVGGRSSNPGHFRASSPVYTPGPDGARGGRGKKGGAGGLQLQGGEGFTGHSGAEKKRGGNGTKIFRTRWGGRFENLGARGLLKGQGPLDFGPTRGGKRRGPDREGGRGHRPGPGGDGAVDAHKMFERGGGRGAAGGRTGAHFSNFRNTAKKPGFTKFGGAGGKDFFRFLGGGGQGNGGGPRFFRLARGTARASKSLPGAGCSGVSGGRGGDRGGGEGGGGPHGSWGDEPTGWRFGFGEEKALDQNVASPGWGGFSGGDGKGKGAPPPRFTRRNQGAGPPEGFAQD